MRVRDITCYTTTGIAIAFNWPGHISVGHIIHIIPFENMLSVEPNNTTLRHVAILFPLKTSLGTI